MEKNKLNKCKFDDCSSKVSCKGYCYTHYRRMCRRGEFGACEVGGCENGKDRGGMCNQHYKRKLRGQPMDTPLRTYFKDDMRESYASGDMQAVLSKIKARCSIRPDSGCWEYPGVTTRGYREVSVGTRTGILAHRLVARAALPDYGDHLQVHHKCANRVCCNPSHLQVVTPQENAAEMMERNYYIKRIKALEEELRRFDENNSVLIGN